MEKKKKKYKMKNKKAFTLAEILITLVIIGVVASLTISNAIHNSHRTQNITKYRKFYSELTQAYDVYLVTNNVSDFSSYNVNPNLGTGMINFIRNNFKTNPPSTQIHSSINGYYTKSGYGGKDNPQIRGLDGTPFWLWRQQAIVLNNGIEISVSCNHPHWVHKIENGQSVGVYKCSLWVDVNGEMRGPNILGEDIFSLLLLNDGVHAWPLPLDLYPKDGYYIPVLDGNTNNSTLEKYRHCTKNSTGAACSGWFLNYNGYER